MHWTDSRQLGIEILIIGEEILVHLGFSRKKCQLINIKIWKTGRNKR